jgi:hypothetical protein
MLVQSRGRRHDAKMDEENRTSLAWSGSWEVTLNTSPGACSLKALGFT